MAAQLTVAEIVDVQNRVVDRLQLEIAQGMAQIGLQVTSLMTGGGPGVSDPQPLNGERPLAVHTARHSV